MDSNIVATWQNMPINEQMANIGSEVSRAYKWEAKGRLDRAMGFKEKAIEFLQMTIDDPKNVVRRSELLCCIEELRGEYDSKPEQVMRYYDAFMR